MTADLEVTTEVSPNITHAENERIANAFDARLKTAEPVQVNEGDDAAKVAAQKLADAKPVKAAESADEIPAQFMDGEPAKKPDVTAEVDEVKRVLELDPPPNLSQKQAANHAQLRKLLETEHAQRMTIAQELEALKSAKPAETVADPQMAEQLKAAQAELEQYKSELERAAFERSPRYKAMVDRQQQAITAAKSYIEGSDIDGAVIEQAARMSGAKRLALLRSSGMDAETIAAVTSELSRHDQVGGERDAAMAQQKELQTQWSQQEQARQTQEEARAKAEEDRVFSSVGDRIKTTFAPFQKVEGNDKWNAQVDSLNAEAKEFFNGSLPLEKLAEIAYAGVAYKVEHRMNEVLRERLKAATMENTRLKSAQPDGGNGTGQRSVGNGAASNDASPTAIASRFDQRKAELAGGG